MHNTMQMTAENNSKPVNNACRGNEAEWSPHPSQKTAQDQRNEQKMQQATTKKKPAVKAAKTLTF